MWATDFAAAPSAGLDPTVQIALIGGLVTLLSLVLSAVLDKPSRKKQPDPPAAVAPVPVPDDRDNDPEDTLIRALIGRAELAEARLVAAEREREHVRYLYERARDRMWLHGINPDDDEDDDKPRPRPRRTPA